MMNEISPDAQARFAQLKDEALRDREIIRTGVSRQALEVLKRRCGYDLPVFQSCDQFGQPYSDTAFVHQAMLRDGKREVICYIETCLSNNKHD